jgi:hypothetical protein
MPVIKGIQWWALLTAIFAHHFKHVHRYFRVFLLLAWRTVRLTQFIERGVYFGRLARVTRLCFLEVTQVAINTSAPTGFQWYFSLTRGDGPCLRTWKRDLAKRFRQEFSRSGSG